MDHSPTSWRQCGRFGWVVARAETWAAITEPGRVLGWVLYGAPTVAGLILGAGEAALGGNPARALSIAAVTAIGLFGALVLLYLAVLTVGEALACTRADRAWLIETDRGRATATAVRRSQGWLVRSVAAWPPHRGLGTEVLTRVVAAADDEHETLVLVAATPATSARFYEPAGFVVVGRRWNGVAMRRCPMYQAPTVPAQAGQDGHPPPRWSPSLGTSRKGKGAKMGSRVQLYADIRHDARVDGLSIRELARKHGVHRRTVRQALAAAELCCC